MPPALAVARMAASAISSIDGLPAFPSRSLGRAVAMACALSGRSFAGRRLITTLPAKRLSYSRRLRSATMRVLGPRGACILRRSRGSRSRRRGGGLFLLRRLRLERAEPVLVFAHTIGVRLLRLSSGRGPALRRLRPPGDEDDHEHAERQTHHQPRLHTPRQRWPRNGPVVGHGRRAGGGKRCLWHMATVLAARTAGARPRAPDTRGR